MRRTLFCQIRKNVRNTTPKVRLVFNSVIPRKIFFGVLISMIFSSSSDSEADPFVQAAFALIPEGEEIPLVISLVRPVEAVVVAVVVRNL